MHLLGHIKPLHGPKTSQKKPNAAKEAPKHDSLESSSGQECSHDCHMCHEEPQWALARAQGAPLAAQGVPLWSIKTLLVTPMGAQKVPWRQRNTGLVEPP